MFKLALEKAEDPEIQLPTFAGSSKCKRVLEKKTKTKTNKQTKKHIYFYFIDYAKTFDCVDHIKVWKILKEMDHLTCFLRNLYASQEAQLELDMVQQTGSK